MTKPDPSYPSRSTGHTSQAPKSWAEEDGHIILRLDGADYSALMVMLGFATTAAMLDRDREMAYRWVALVNRLNCGNPYYRPYEVPDEVHEGWREEQRG